MDASRKIQRSIHDVKLIVQFITVSRKLGTYHAGGLFLKYQLHQQHIGDGAAGDA